MRCGFASAEYLDSNREQLQQTTVCAKNETDLMSSPENTDVLCVTFFRVPCLCVAVCRKAALLFGWAVFLLLAYKVSKLDREYQEYNPYEVLNLDPVNAHKT